jgi:hypothetical protein
MRDKLETTQVVDDADLDVVNGGYGNIWMACYFTAQHTINKIEQDTFQALLEDARSKA